MDNRAMYPVKPGQVATRDVLTRRELADRWGYRSTRSIDRLLREGKANDAPRHFRVGARVLFRRQDVEDFEKRRLVRQRPF